MKGKYFNLKSGESNYLVISFPNKIDVIDMDGAETYKCRVIFDNECEIPNRYEKSGSGKSWCKLYDDTGAVMVVYGENVDIYRVGESGILVHAYGETEGWIESFV